MLNAEEYAGVYRAGGKALALEASAGGLLLRRDGETVALEQRGKDRFYAPHPDLDLFQLEFGRVAGTVVEAFHGPDWYVTDAYTGPRHFEHPPEWAAYEGHYRARNPELSNFRVVLRKGALLVIYPSGSNEPLAPLDDGRFRLGSDPRSPETLRFDAVVDGRALRAVRSGCPYYRTFTP